MKNCYSFQNDNYVGNWCMLQIIAFFGCYAINQCK